MQVTNDLAIIFQRPALKDMLIDSADSVIAEQVKILKMASGSSFGLDALVR